MHTVIQSVLAMIRRHDMIQPGDHVLVGVSGGPDSMVLLNVLVRLREELGCSLHVAHLNHCLRGTESLADAEFVAEQARNFGLPVTIEAHDVHADQQEASLEARAREIRYAFFERAADAVGAHKIALGHHADDHVETVLMRFLRGSGLAGLGGIPSTRDRYIRPLLGIHQWELECYLHERGLASRQDESNMDTRFLRNRIRHELLPFLEQHYNPSIREGLIRLAELATCDNSYLDELAAEHLMWYLRHEEDGGVSLECADLLSVHVSLQRRMVRLMLGQLDPRLSDIQYAHIEGILHLAQSPHPNARLDLPNQIQVVRVYNRLHCHRQVPTAESNGFEISGSETLLVIPGTTTFPGGQIVATLEDQWSTLPDGRSEILLNASMLQWDMVVRSRRPGDQFQPFGMIGRQKLKDFLINQKIPVSLRDQIPLVACRDEILWVVGYRASEASRVTPDTRPLLRLRYHHDANTDG